MTSAEIVEKRSNERYEILASNPSENCPSETNP